MRKVVLRPEQVITPFYLSLKHPRWQLPPQRRHTMRPSSKHAQTHTVLSKGAATRVASGAVRRAKGQLSILPPVLCAGGHISIALTCTAVGRCCGCCQGGCEGICQWLDAFLSQYDPHADRQPSKQRKSLAKAHTAQNTYTQTSVWTRIAFFFLTRTHT